MVKTKRDVLWQSQSGLLAKNVLILKSLRSKSAVKRVSMAVSLTFIRVLTYIQRSMKSYDKYYILGSCCSRNSCVDWLQGVPKS